MYYAIIVSHNSVWVVCIFKCFMTIVLCICIQGETLIKYYLSIIYETKQKTRVSKFECECIK